MHRYDASIVVRCLCSCAYFERTKNTPNDGSFWTIRIVFYTGIPKV